MTPFLPCQLALDPKLPPLSHLLPLCAPAETADDFLFILNMSDSNDDLKDTYILVLVNLK